MRHGIGRTAKSVRRGAVPALAVAALIGFGPALSQPVPQLPKPPPLGAPTPAPTPPTPRPAPAPVPTPAPAPLAFRLEDAARSAPLRPNQPVQVTLRRGQSAFFRVGPEAGQYYSIITRRLARNTDTVLEALDARGESIVEDDDGGGGLASLLEIGPEDRVATIRAGTVGNEGGTFEVVVNRENAPPPPDFATTQADAANRPALQVDRPVRIRLRRGQQAYFAVPPDLADLVATTRELRTGTDTVLALLDARGEVVAEDDDGGDGLASLLPLSGQSGGPFVLRASSLGSGAAEFELVLQREAAPAPANFPTSLEEARARGPLAVGSAVSIELGRRQSAFFALPPGQDIVALTRGLSNGTDTVLALLDDQGQVILEDDDGGEGLASRVSTGDAGRPAAFIRAGVLGNGPGRFELVLEQGQPAAPASDVPGTVQDASGQVPLTVGQSVSLRIRPGQAAVFAIPQEGGALVAMTYGLTRNTDTVLEVLDRNGTVLVENDDADGLASRVAIAADGRAAFLRARLLGNAIGDFQLVVVRPAP